MLIQQRIALAVSISLMAGAAVVFLMSSAEESDQTSSSTRSSSGWTRMLQLDPSPLPPQNCDTSFVAGTCLRIKARHSGKYLMPLGKSTAEAASIVQDDISVGDTAGDWIVESSVTGYYHLVNQASNYAMNVGYASTENGANIIQYRLHPYAANDDFCFDKVGTTGYHLLVNRNSHRLIDIEHAFTTSGANALQYDRKSQHTENQEFLLEPCPTPGNDGVCTECIDPDEFASLTQLVANLTQMANDLTIEKSELQIKVTQLEEKTVCLDDACPPTAYP